MQVGIGPARPGNCVGLSSISLHPKQYMRNHRVRFPFIACIAVIAASPAARAEAQVGNVLKRAAKAAVTPRNSSTPDVEGTYALERFGGQQLPTNPSSGAGQFHRDRGHTDAEEQSG